MKRYTLLYMSALLAAPCAMQAQTLADNSIVIENKKVEKTDHNLVVDLTLNMDSLRLRSNQRIVFTPIVRSTDGQQRTMPQIVVNGRKQDISYKRYAHKDYPADAQSVRRKNGTEQSYQYNAVVPYEDWMKNADVVIAEDLCGCGDIYDGNEYLLRRRRKPAVAFLRPAAEARKLRHIDKTAYIDFPVNSTELYSDYRRNPSELDSIIRTINFVKADKNLHIRRIGIHGYASPEGSYAANERLARGRAVTLKDYVRRLVALDDTVFAVSHTAEDWDGLVDSINGGGIANKQAVLDIIADKTLGYDEREWKIKNAFPDDYRYMLDNWYPALRRSDYRISYVVRPFSVDEARRIIRVKPQQLSLEEMFLVAQTYSPGSDEFNEVMDIAVRMFPDDPTANLNAACAHLDAGDADGAKPYLDKAGSGVQAKNALAAYYYLKGCDDKAASLFRQAAGEGLPEAAANLGNM